MFELLHQDKMTGGSRQTVKLCQTVKPSNFVVYIFKIYKRHEAFEYCPNSASVGVFGPTEASEGIRFVTTDVLFLQWRHLEVSRCSGTKAFWNPSMCGHGSKPGNEEGSLPGSLKMSGAKESLETAQICPRLAVDGRCSRSCECVATWCWTGCRRRRLYTVRIAQLQRKHLAGPRYRSLIDWQLISPANTGRQHKSDEFFYGEAFSSSVLLMCEKISHSWNQIHFVAWMVHQHRPTYSLHSVLDLCWAPTGPDKN